MYGCGKDCLILIPFRLPQISCFTLSLKCFSSDSDNCPTVGIGPLLQFPHLPRAVPVLLTLLFSPLFPSSYQFFLVLYIIFHWSGTPVCSHLVFCMHFCVWRYIPDVSLKRDVLLVHLLLHHLVLSTGLFLSFSLVKKILHHVPLHSCIRIPLCVYSDIILEKKIFYA